MKILIITQKYDFNDSTLGAFIEWWDRLAAKVEKVYILALEKKSEPILSNIEVLSMGKEKGIGFFKKIIGFYSGLFKLIGESDAILVHMVPKYVILAAPVALIYGKPIYLWYTGVSVHWKLRLAVLFCRKIFTAHKAAMRINTKKRIITGHGIDTGKFHMSHVTCHMSHVTILSAGRITPSKGHDLIVEAVADLIKSGYNLELKIIGDVIQAYHQNYLISLKSLAKKLEAENNVEFTGAVSYEQMPQYFDRAQILINAVPFGGLDKVVLEAMASGIIPLTSNSAFSDVFPQEYAASLIFKKGNLEDLKTKFKNILDKKLYQDETFCRRLRNVVVENHNLNNLIDRIAKEIYNR